MAKKQLIIHHDMRAYPNTANSSVAVNGGSATIKDIKGNIATLYIFGYGDVEVTITPEQKKLIKVGDKCHYTLNTQHPL